MGIQKTYRRSISLLVTLVAISFGIFDTSGHIVSTVQDIPNKVELTLGHQNSNEAHKTFILKTHASSLANSSYNFPVAYLFDVTYLINYNTLVSVKCQSIAEKLNFSTPISHFTQRTRITLNSDDTFKS